MMKMKSTIASFSALLLATVSVRADIQITASQVVSGPASSSSQTVIKIAENRSRVDTGPSSSTISFSDKAEQLQLFHQTKTYLRQAVGTNRTGVTGAPEPVAAGATTLDGKAADLYIWVDGPKSGRIWTAPLTHFPQGTAATLTDSKARSPLSSRAGVGSVFATNFIVIATERNFVTPLVFPPPGNTNASGSAVSNLTHTVFSKLLSITETNFSPSEFEIPPGYVEAAGPPEQPRFQLDPAIFGRGPVGPGTMDLLRKEFEHGSPVLKAP
jgi:hypothetical protein